MSDDTVLIREATAADCPKILRLFQQLAEYDGMPNSVLNDVKTLEEDGFGEVPYYKCVVAEDTSSKTLSTTNSDPISDNLVGYCLYFFAFAWEGKTLYMEDIYVTPAYRGKSLGTKLWQAIIKFGQEAEAQSCRFTVLYWNAPSIAFYKSKGAQDVSAAKGFRYYRMATRASLEQVVARDIPEGGGEAAPEVRRAIMADLPVVMEMKSLLATEAGLNMDTQLTLEELTAGISSSPPLCHVMVAKDAGGHLLGFALFSLAYSSWRGRSFYFEDLFVKPDFRDKGVGARLVKASFQYCLSLGCCRGDLIVSETNAPAIAYYQTLGAVDLSKSKGWQLMFMDKVAMDKMVDSEGRSPLISDDYSIDKTARSRMVDSEGKEPSH